MSAIPKTMQACVMDAVGHTSIVELPVPTIEDDEVLCKVHAIAICGSDPEVIMGHFKWLNWPPFMPFVLGHEWSGEVVQVGKNVLDFKEGDRVAGEAHCGCGKCENCKKGSYTICLNYGKRETGHRHYGFYDQGANAGYIAVKTKSLTKIPDSLPYHAAALNDTGGVALHCVELAGITAQGTVVIYGPGPIGLCMLGVVKSLGPNRVAMVGRGHRLQTAKELGADILIDFEKDDPVEKVMELTGGVGADQVFEASGAVASPARCLRSVRKGGTIGMAGFFKDGQKVDMPVGMIINSEIRIVGSKANPNVSAKVIRMLDKGIIGWERIVTHRMPLAKYADALDIFMNRKDNVVKMVVEPWA